MNALDKSYFTEKELHALLEFEKKYALEDEDTDEDTDEESQEDMLTRLENDYEIITSEEDMILFVGDNLYEFFENEKSALRYLKEYTDVEYNEDIKAYIVYKRYL